VLIRRRDDAAVLERDFVDRCDALEERCAVGPGGPRTVGGEREHRDGVGAAGQLVDADVLVLFREVHTRVPGDAAPATEQKPDPLRGNPPGGHLPRVGVPFAALPVAGEFLQLREQLERLGLGEVALGQLPLDGLDEVDVAHPETWLDGLCLLVPAGKACASAPE
jgi:hypothetical protein